MEVRMNHPLEGEPLTVLVMPNITVTEHMFDDNDLGYCIVYTYALYIVLFLDIMYNHISRLNKESCRILATAVII